MRGIKTVFKEEQNFKVHIFCSIIVIFFAFFLRVEVIKIMILLISISFLLILEIVNTVFEKLVDIAKPRVHHYIAFIKDVMAGAVLIAALTCALTTIVILLPEIIKYVQA